MCLGNEKMFRKIGRIFFECDEKNIVEDDLEWWYGDL